MSYQPQFIITPALLAGVESIAALRERIQGAAVQVPWIPALQKDTRARNTHSSTAIEGNPLTLEEVRALEEGNDRGRTGARATRGAELFRRAAACREAGGEEAVDARGYFPAARHHRGRGDGSGRGGALPDDAGAGGAVCAATAGGCVGPDVRAAGMVEQGSAGNLAGAEFGHRASSLRDDSSVCRWQRAHGPGAGVVGALPARV